MTKSFAWNLVLQLVLKCFFFGSTNWGISPARNVRDSDSRARVPEPQKHTKKSKKSIKGTIRVKDIVIPRGNDNRCYDHPRGLHLGFHPFRLLEVHRTRQFPVDF